MIKSTFSLIAIICGFAVHSQWLELFGEEYFTSHFYQVIECSDGSLALCGMHHQPGLSTYHGRLTKTTSEGELIWEQTYFPDTYCELVDLIEGDDGSFYLCGVIYNKGAINSVVMKTDSEGELIWSIIYGSDYHNRLFGLVQTPDGVLCAGEYHIAKEQLTKSWLVKLNYSGIELWNQLYDTSSEARAIIEVENGYITTGSFWDGVQRDLTLSKVNFFGEEQWTYQFGDDGLEVGTTVVMLNNGNLVIGGFEDVDDSNYDFLYLCTDGDGNQIWSHVYDETSMDMLDQIVATSDGGYASSGHYQGDYPEGGIWLAKFDSSGLIDWEHHLTHNHLSRAHCITQSSDNGIVVGGWKRYDHPDGWTWTHALLHKTQANGTTVPLNTTEWVQSTDQVLVGIVNLLGQQIENPLPGQLVIYQYSNGSTEKRMILSH